MGLFLSKLLGIDEDSTIDTVSGNVKINGNTYVVGNTKISGASVSGNASASSTSIKLTSAVGTSTTTTTLNPSIKTTVTNNTITFTNGNNIQVNSHGIPLEFSDFLKEVFEAAHLYILLWFILIYLVVYYGFGYLLKNKGIQSVELILSRIFDLMIFIPLTAFLLYKYYTASQDTKDHILIRIWDWSIEWMDDIMNLFGVFLFMFCFYLMVGILGMPMSKESQPYSIHLIESKIWIYIAFFIILMFFKHFLKLDLLVITDKYVKEWTNTASESTSNLQDYLTPVFNSANASDSAAASAAAATNTTSSVNTTTQPVPTKVNKMDEVFNISNNLYTYEDAKQICSVYGARLANYEDIEDSYNHGGEWCNYGWSEGQMAFFPTQTSTWNNLQKNPKTKNSCGRPGINGGYIENPYIRFGVNCYGQKPDAKPSDLEKMNQPVTVAKTKEEIAIDQKMQFWKDNADKLLQINTFNKSKWSEF